MQEHDDAQHDPIDCGQLNDDFSTVEADLARVQADGTAITDAAGLIDGAAAAVAIRQTELRNAFAALEAAAGTHPNGEAPAYTQADVDAALAPADTRVRTATAARDDLQARANQIADDAATLANQAAADHSSCAA